MNDYNGSVTDTTKLEALAREYAGFTYSYKASGWDLDRLKQEIEAGHPVIVAVTAGYLSDRGYGYSGEYFIVAKGYSSTHIICNDPGTSQGKDKHYANSEFSLAMPDKGGSVVVVVPSPVADAGEEQSVSSGDLVFFDGFNSYYPDGTIASYEWDFGDGETATSCNVIHRFRGALNESKTYDVTLTVEDDTGTTDTDGIHVTVAPLEKIIEISHPFEGLLAQTIASYNWVWVNEDGEDVYAVSKVCFEGQGILAMFFPSGIPIPYQYLPRHGHKQLGGPPRKHLLTPLMVIGIGESLSTMSTLKGLP